MAPELAEGKDATFGTDVYALGVVLYEMLTGHVPFRGSSAVATLRQQVESPTPTLTGIVPDLPPQLDPILGSAMAKEADARYPTARAFAAALATVCRTPELAKLARSAAPPKATAPTMPVAGSAASAAPTLRATADTARTASAEPTQTVASTSRAPRPRWLVPAIAGACLGLLALGVALTVHPLRATDTDVGRAAKHGATSTSPKAVATASAPGTAIPPPTTLSKGRFCIHVLPDSTVTGRIVSIDPDWVRIQTDDGTVERIAYGSVLRIEKQGGR